MFILFSAFSHPPIPPNKKSISSWFCFDLITIKAHRPIIYFTFTHHTFPPTNIPTSIPPLPISHSSLVKPYKHPYHFSTSPFPVPAPLTHSPHHTCHVPLTLCPAPRGKKASLMVLRANRNDTGIFSCVVNNGIGKEAMSNATLVVKTKPQVERSQVGAQVDSAGDGVNIFQGRQRRGP